MDGDRTVRLKQYWQRWKLRWAPVACIRRDEGRLRYDVLTPVGWQQCEAETLPRPTPFSSLALLIPDRDCCFRHRHFPFDMLAVGDIDEAVALDIKQWSPFKADKTISWFFLTERHEDTWHVAIWIWPEETASQLLAQLPTGMQCTHMMPEMGWYVAQLRVTAPALLIARSADADGYAMVSVAGVPLAIAWPLDEVAARRFWRGLGAEVHRVEQVWLCGGDEAAPVWQPKDVNAMTMPAIAPRHTLLNRARMDGLHDWSDPFTWRRPAVALCALLLVWALADAAVLMKRGRQLEQTLTTVQRSARDVLQQRDRVDYLQLRLQRFSALRQLQQRPERLLAALSRKVPDDIWLDVIQKIVASGLGVG